MVRGTLSTNPSFITYSITFYLQSIYPSTHTQTHTHIYSECYSTTLPPLQESWRIQMTAIRSISTSTVPASVVDCPAPPLIDHYSGITVGPAPTLRPERNELQLTAFSLPISLKRVNI